MKFDFAIRIAAVLITAAVVKLSPDSVLFHMDPGHASFCLPRHIMDIWMQNHIS